MCATWAFFLSRSHCVARAIARVVSGISGFGLGCQTRRVGLWGGGFLEFGIQMFLGF